MAGIDDQIRELQEELERTPYNKATSKHIGRIKAKIARLRDEAVSRAMKSAGGGEGFTVKKSGDATVVLVGFPSTGKSTLLNKLTGTNSEVGAYAFTTLTVVPGALEHKGAKIQILDIPGLIAGAAMGKGRGKEVIGVVRGADFIVVLVDVFNEAHVDVLLRELYDAGIRVNTPRPDITIKKTGAGGVQVHAVGDLDLDLDEIRSILNENKLMNADVLIRGNSTQDELIDAMIGNRVYVPALIVVNKVDLVDDATRDQIEAGSRRAVRGSAGDDLGRDGLPHGGAQGQYLRAARVHAGLPQAHGRSGRPGRAPDRPDELDRRGRLPQAPPRVRGEVPVRPGLGRLGQAPGPAGRPGPPPRRRRSADDHHGPVTPGRAAERSSPW